MQRYLPIGAISALLCLTNLLAADSPPPLIALKAAGKIVRVRKAAPEVAHAGKAGLHRSLRIGDHLARPRSFVAQPSWLLGQAGILPAFCLARRRDARVIPRLRDWKPVLRHL